MTIIEKYKTYRKIGMELNHKIMDSCLDRDVLMKSARLLGIARGKTLIFDSEDETSVLMDFALNEYRVNNKNTIEIYREKIGWQNEIEKDILDALLSSYTSLFKVTSIYEAENTLLLNDILNKKDNLKLIDIAFSKTAIPGLLLFIRLIPFKDFNMTSGISFAFPGDLEEYLLRRYKKLSKKVKTDSESIKRFISFFRLSKTDGIEVGYV
ncbi:MAG: hypothetical protein DRN07_03330 [Thermoplasmata archaeon]|nr:MAG: hypothetical protein DRN07_03330 [Thermoplasmata archaeon]